MKGEEDNKTVLGKSGREILENRKNSYQNISLKKKIKERRSKAHKTNFKSYIVNMTNACMCCVLK